MKTLFKLLIVLWLLLLTVTNKNMLDAQNRTTLTLRGVVDDVNNLQIERLPQR
jgi:hypothetical protein